MLPVQQIPARILPSPITSLRCLLAQKNKLEREKSQIFSQFLKALDPRFLNRKAMAIIIPKVLFTSLMAILAVISLAASATASEAPAPSPPPPPPPSLSLPSPSPSSSHPSPSWPNPSASEGRVRMARLLSCSVHHRCLRILSLPVLHS